jgi:transcriptional regulator with PAS, ATPase and Fis domain
VIQEREFTPLGDTQPRRVDVRIIAATYTDLRRAVDNGDFREDLFYRLNVINIHLPPLRDRREDILPLAQHFIRKYSGKPIDHGSAVARSAPGAGDLSLAGNVRSRDGA